MHIEKNSQSYQRGHTAVIIHHKVRIILLNTCYKNILLQYKWFFQASSFPNKKFKFFEHTYMPKK